MNILVLNGPNINLLGLREPDIYGKADFQALLSLLRETGAALGVRVDQFQSNHEGALVDAIQQAYGVYDGIVINPGAYTHTSIALADAVKAIAPLPTVEVHISDISIREEFRKISYEAPYCIMQIKGHGFQGYIEALHAIKDYVSKPVHPMGCL